MYLLDTNACIRFLRDPDSVVARRLAAVLVDEVALCTVVKAELYYGARRSADPDRSIQVLEAFLAVLPACPLTISLRRSMAASVPIWLNRAN